MCRLSGFGVRHAKLRPRSQGLCSHEATAPVSYAAVSMPDWVQYSPNSSAGCGARSEPLPQRLSLTGQYKSQPRHTRSGCWGLGELLGGHDCLALPVAAFWLFARRRHIRATAVRNLGCHPNALAQRGVRVDGLADVHRVDAHLDGQGDLTDHVARVRAHDAAVQDIAVAVRLG